MEWSCDMGYAPECMREKSKILRLPGEPRTEQEVMFMPLAAGCRLMMRVKISMKAQPLLEVCSGGEFPSAGPFLQIAMQQRIACRKVCNAKIIGTQGCGYGNKKEKACNGASCRQTQSACQLALGPWS